MAILWPFKKIIILYIFSEMIPAFIMGIVIFISIVFMMQFMQISESMLIHNVSLSNMIKIMLNMVVSFLPIVLPTSLMFSVVLTYARLSSDSELVALKALGYSYFYLTLPAVLFSAIIAILSAQTLFVVAPLARFNFDELMTSISNQQIISAIKEKTFSEDFFGFTIYANEVDEKEHLIKDVFIQDRRIEKSPITIVAKSGIITAGSDLKKQVAQIELKDGVIYSKDHTQTSQIQFKDYSIMISTEIAESSEDRDLNTYTFSELLRNIKNIILPAQKVHFVLELHRRITMALSCLIFGVLGALLGFGVNRRSGSSIGFILSVSFVGLYWLLYAVVLSTAGKSKIHLEIIMWIPNIIFLLITLWRGQHLRKSG